MYLVCTYKTGQIISQLVISRARVAPLKIQSLPKLELMAALLCARMIKFVKHSLKLSDDTKLCCYTDSQATLAWIKGEPHRWKTFIANRVVQIQELTDPADWKFVSGIQNPADLVTRGISAKELMDSEYWLIGPPFLREKNSILESPSTFENPILPNLSKFEKSTISLVVIEERKSVLFEVDRWSSFSKALRVIAWVLRFLHNVKFSRQKKIDELSIEELTVAKLHLLKYAQQQEYSSELNSLKKGTEVSRHSPIFKLNPFLGHEINESWRTT